jgi:DNA modification methylase
LSSSLSSSIVDYPFERELKGKRLLYGPLYKNGYDLVLSCNDVEAFLESVPENSISLIVTSPPYNIGKPYENRVQFEQYLTWQKKVISECVKKLKPDGSICWEIGNYIEDREVFPLDVYMYSIFKDQGLKLRNRIVWTFGHGLHASLRFSGRYEVILWFTKTDTYTFNLDPVRIPQKYPGKTAYKGPDRGQPSSNPLGKNPSDLWNVLLEDWEAEIWNIPNVKSNHPEKTIHPAQFPIELVERLVLALTRKDESVMDPFAGVGSSLIAALLNGRRAIGVDRERSYTDIAFNRIVNALNGKLKRRHLGTRVWEPKGTEKVARPPAQWNNQTLTQLIQKTRPSRNHHA